MILWWLDNHTDFGKHQAFHKPKLCEWSEYLRTTIRGLRQKLYANPWRSLRSFLVNSIVTSMGGAVPTFRFQDCCDVVLHLQESLLDLAGSVPILKFHRRRLRATHTRTLPRVSPGTYWLSNTCTDFMGGCPNLLETKFAKRILSKTCEHKHVDQVFWSPWLDRNIGKQFSA